MTNKDICVALRLPYLYINRKINKALKPFDIVKDIKSKKIELNTKEYCLVAGSFNYENRQILIKYMKDI